MFRPRVASGNVFLDPVQLLDGITLLLHSDGETIPFNVYLGVDFLIVGVGGEFRDGLDLTHGIFKLQNPHLCQVECIWIESNWLVQVSYRLC